MKPLGESVLASSSPLSAARHLVDRVMTRIEDFLAQVVGVALFATALLITGNVLMRFFLNRPISVIPIVELYLLVAIVFLPLGILQRRDGNIKVDVFSRRFSETTRFVIRVTHRVAITIILLLITHQQYVSMVRAYSNSEVRPGLINFPLYPSWALASIGLTVLLLRLGLQFIDELPWETDE